MPVLGTGDACSIRVTQTMKCYKCLKEGKIKKAKTMMRGYSLCLKHAKSLRTESYGA